MMKSLGVRGLIHAFAIHDFVTPLKSIHVFPDSISDMSFGLI